MTEHVVRMPPAWKYATSVALSRRHSVSKVVSPLGPLAVTSTVVPGPASAIPRIV